MSDDGIDFVGPVKAEIKKQGINRSRLAAATGEAKSTINPWLYRQKRINDRALGKILAALGFTLMPPTGPAPSDPSPPSAPTQPDPTSAERAS